MNQLRWRFFFLSVIVPLIFSACIFDGEIATKPRTFSVESILLTASAFPDEWYDRGILETADSHSALEHLSSSIVHPAGGDAYHEIYRYEYIDDAIEEYKRQMGFYFNYNPHRYEKFTVKNELRSALDFADEAHVACASYIGGENEFDNCQILARYEEYIIRFHTEVVEPYLTYEELAQIMNELDDNFETRLQ